MMRGHLPLFALVVLAVAAPAVAQEMIEIPNPPPPPPPCCCCVEEPPPPPPSAPSGSLYFAVAGAAAYRRAFGADLGAASLDVALGGQTAKWSLGARLRLDAGAIDGLLPYQQLAIGTALLVRVSPRVALGGAINFGFFWYERASAARVTDPIVWAPTIGGELDLTVDLVRTARGGAFFAHARANLDYIDTAADPGTTDGMSVAVAAGLGYRY
ncbi:MAG TPA: hypothetical protein VGL86_12315 [Polyangia bacterium]|jgi:hypothetical protein